MDHRYEWLKLPSEKAAWSWCVRLEHVVMTVVTYSRGLRWEDEALPPAGAVPRWAPLEPWERLLPWYFSIRKAFCSSPFLNDVFPYALERIFVLPCESG